MILLRVSLINIPNLLSLEDKGNTTNFMCSGKGQLKDICLNSFNLCRSTGLESTMPSSRHVYLNLKS